MLSDAFAYIDPGTGSMLFTVMIGLGTVVYFFLKNAWLKLKFFLSGSKPGIARNQKRLSYAIYNEGNQYWNLFQPILAEFESRALPVAYLTSAEDDPVFLTQYQYVTSAFIGVGNRAYAHLNRLEADICLMTTPSLDVYQLKRSPGVAHYAHILHAVDDATGYRLFGLDYFDSVFLTGEYQIENIRILEQKRHLPAKKLIVAGCPYLDRFREKIASIVPEDNKPFTVLVSPSWGPSGLLSRYGERLLDPLAQSGLRVIIRPHPQSIRSEAPMIERLQARYASAERFEWDFLGENIPSMSRSDVMISDFSGIIFDFCFLFDKPLLYVNRTFDNAIYDSSDIEGTPWKFRVLADLGKELEEKDFPNLARVVQDMSSNDAYAVKRRQARETAWQNIGKSAVVVVDNLTSIREALA